MPKKTRKEIKDPGYHAQMIQTFGVLQEESPWDRYSNSDSSEETQLHHAQILYKLTKGKPFPWSGGVWKIFKTKSGYRKEGFSLLRVNE